MAPTTLQDSVPTVLTGTVGFTRKVQPAQYEGAEASIYIQFDYPPDADVTEIVAKANDAFAQAKSIVFEQVGVEFSVEEGGRIVETLRQKFGAVEPQGQPQRSAAQQASVDPTRTCENCGGNEFYDNRPKKASGEFKANSPDLKCKDKACGKGIWLKGGK